MFIRTFSLWRLILLFVDAFPPTEDEAAEEKINFVRPAFGKAEFYVWYLLVYFPRLRVFVVSSLLGLDLFGLASASREIFPFPRIFDGWFIEIYSR